MKRIYCVCILSLLLLSLGCEDNNQIIDISNDDPVFVDEGDTICIDTLFLFQAGRTDAVVGFKMSLPDSIDVIECGIELSTDSIFKDEVTTKVKSEESLFERDILYIVLDNLKPNEQYYYRVYYYYHGLEKTGKILSFKTFPLECSYVDLGLSVYWATCNVGANVPEQYGSYYAWGEIDTKSIYNWSTYKWKRDNNTLLSKYCSINEYGIMDNESNLELEDDIAHSLYGEDWHIPSDKEWYELENNCKWEWTTVNNTNGWLITSQIEGYKDKSIFLPVSGIIKDDKLEEAGSSSYYWSRRLYDSYPRSACTYYLDSIGHAPGLFSRYYGLPIRPVCVSNGWYEHASISLSCTEITVFPGYSFNLDATVSYNNSIVHHSGVWSSDNPAVAIVDDNGSVVVLSEGIANIYFTINSIDSKCTVNVLASESAIKHDYVDLGLSVNWATFNVGAITPEGSGALYAWGEIETKDSYTSLNYKYADKYQEEMTQLALSDDVAHEKWGDNWRMPSEKEFQELKNNCNWKRTILNGTTGYVVSSKITGFTDRFIFLPETEVSYRDSKGVYWSNSNYVDWHQYEYAYAYEFNYGLTLIPRNAGCSVRPVIPSETWMSSISIEIEMDSTIFITNTQSELNAKIKRGDDIIYSEKEIEWSISDTSVAIILNHGVDYVTVQAVSSGTAIITAFIGSVSAQYEIVVHDESEFEHEYVDLGLSVNWAKTNLGTMDEYRPGSRFAWGETNAKKRYVLETYKWYEGSAYYSKYNESDNKIVLDIDDDAAHVTWGGEWRMPTIEEIDELIGNCTITRQFDYLIVQSNVEGFTDRYIIFPLEKTTLSYYTIHFDHYWTSSLTRADISANETGSGSKLALGVQMFTEYRDQITPFKYDRYEGFLIRPVVPSSK